MTPRIKPYIPRKRSAADRGIIHIGRVGRPVSAIELAAILHVPAKLVAAFFDLAVSKGALVKTVVNHRAWYEIGANVPLAPRQKTVRLVREQANPYSRPVRVSSVFELGALAQAAADMETEGA